MPRCAANTAQKHRCKRTCCSESLFCSTHKSIFEHVNFKECSICLSDIVRNEKVTACGHHYHSGCLREWLRTKNTCPYCRYVLGPPKIFNILNTETLQQVLQRLDDSRIQLILANIMPQN
jgi:hypothetical protein